MRAWARNFQGVEAPGLSLWRKRPPNKDTIHQKTQVDGTTTGRERRMHKGKGEMKNATQTPRERQGTGPPVEAGRGGGGGGARGGVRDPRNGYP